MQARLAFGILLALGLADLAVLNLHLAPQLSAVPTDVPPPVKPPVAEGSALAKASSVPTPLSTAPSPTSVAPPPTTTAVAEVSASASPSNAPVPSGTPTASTTTVEPPAEVSVTERPPERRPLSSTPGEAIPDIVFDLDSHMIPSVSAITDLKEVAQTLNREPGKRIVIRGHSDQMGSPEYKRALSQRRAMTVQRFLVSHGAPPDRISLEAVSDNEPADARNNPVAWAQNRRVQVIWR